MCCRGWVASQRLGIAEIHKRGDQFERNVELDPGSEARLDTKGDQGATLAFHILLCQRLIRAAGETGIVDPLNPGVLAQEFSNVLAIFNMAFNLKCNRLHPLQKEKCAHRSENSSSGPLIDTLATPDIRGSPKVVGVTKS